MAGSRAPRLVVVADDFGSSQSVNRAVREAREAGILTAASLMAAGSAFEEAIRIGLEQRISLGLHLTLCDGASVLPPSEIPGLVDRDGQFEKNPARAWIKYSRAALLPQIESEISAQFDRLEESAVRPHHVDGHHHLHLHPVIFPLVCRIAAARGVRWIRVSREPLLYVLASRGRGAMPILERTVFGMLGSAHRSEAGRNGLRIADRIFGLARTGHMDEKNLLKTLNSVKHSHRVVEIFAHPDSTEPAGRRELEALLSARVRAKLGSAGIRLAGYGDLMDIGSAAAENQ